MHPQGAFIISLVCVNGDQKEAKEGREKKKNHSAGPPFPPYLMASE
jgi:hypothetical protein